MAAKEPFEIPVGMGRVCRRFERWRKGHKARDFFPSSTPVPFPARCRPVARVALGKGQPATGTFALLAPVFHGDRLAVAIGDGAGCRGRRGWRRRGSRRR
jgi:hypothetical protein